MKQVSIYLHHDKFPAETPEHITELIQELIANLKTTDPELKIRVWHTDLDDIKPKLLKLD